jgi:glycosyltransferase involved in cell wall biosynthesis
VSNPSADSELPGEAAAADLPLFTVVMPACNEGNVIARCLIELRKQLTGGRLEILVVCNGCRDKTADIARQQAALDPRIKVYELAEGSKPGAIRAGFGFADPTSAVVAVIDADIVLSSDALEGMMAALDTPTPRITAPQVLFDLSQCSPAVRRYYAVYKAEPYVADGVIGLGIYAVNSSGLERIRALPNVLGDDGWARAQFDPVDRITSTGTFTVFPARTLKSLIRRRARIDLSVREMVAIRKTSYVPTPSATSPGRQRVARTGLANELTFFGVTRAAATIARYRLIRGRAGHWTVDKTSRVPQVEGPPS